MTDKSEIIPYVQCGVSAQLCMSVTGTLRIRASNHVSTRPSQIPKKSFRRPDAPADTRQLLSDSWHWSRQHILVGHRMMSVPTAYIFTRWQKKKTQTYTYVRETLGRLRTSQEKEKER